MKEDMKLAVVGSRGWQDKDAVFQHLNSRDDIEEVVSGGANGPDSFAEMWAKENGIPCKVFKPDWKQYGKRAGFLRNTEIVGYCDEKESWW